MNRQFIRLVNSVLEQYYYLYYYGLGPTPSLVHLKDAQAAKFNGNPVLSTGAVVVQKLPVRTPCRLDTNLTPFLLARLLHSIQIAALH
jgi:hypothetical protein